ncbi:MAG: hypothetical protein KY437_11075 [Actinobacteria bacterium]|nr:hypothetical protein [Actinomycetota bacterium]
MTTGITGALLAAQDVPADDAVTTTENVFGLLALIAFVVVMFLLNRWLRRRDREGDHDPGPSGSSTPGVRLLFDYSERGWRDDGIRQEPPE